MPKRPYFTRPANFSTTTPDLVLLQIATLVAYLVIMTVANLAHGAHGVLDLSVALISTILATLFTDIRTAIVVNLVPSLATTPISILRGGSYRHSLGTYRSLPFESWRGPPRTEAAANLSTSDLYLSARGVNPRLSTGGATSPRIYVLDPKPSSHFGCGLWYRGTPCKQIGEHRPPPPLLTHFSALEV